MTRIGCSHRDCTTFKTLGDDEVQDGLWLCEVHDPANNEDCPNSKDDRGHCPHWWDGDGCCWCDSGPMTQEAMYENGMLEGKPDPEAHAARVAEWKKRKNKSDS